MAGEVCRWLGKFADGWQILTMGRLLNTHASWVSVAELLSDAVKISEMLRGFVPTDRVSNYTVRRENERSSASGQPPWHKE